MFIISSICKFNDIFCNTQIKPHIYYLQYALLQDSISPAMRINLYYLPILTISLIQIYRLISRFSTCLTISSLCRMNNDLFADNSWYFRNALIRANYRNVRKEVEPDMRFLNLFFRNLMMGENHELKNGFVAPLYPNNPKHPRQKYLLTVKGLAIFNSTK